MQSQKVMLPTRLIFQGRSSTGHSSSTPMLSLADAIKGDKWNKLTFHGFVTKISFHQLQQENWKREVTEQSEESWWFQALLTPQLSALPRPCSCFFWYPDITHHTGDMEYFSSEWIPSPSNKALRQTSKLPSKSAAPQWTQPSIPYLLPPILLLLTLAFSFLVRGSLHHLYSFV